MLNKVNNRLIVLKFYVLPANVLFHVLCLFYLEHLFVEDLLQLFICVVYAKLLKWILLKYFESKNVKQPYKRKLFLFVLGVTLAEVDSWVYFVNYPSE